MEVEIIKQDQDYIEARIDADIGFLQLLKEKLFSDRSVEFAAVVRDHPFLSPRLIVRTKGKKDPADAIKESLEKIKDEIKSFAEGIKR